MSGRRGARRRGARRDAKRPAHDPTPEAPRADEAPPPAEGQPARPAARRPAVQGTTHAGVLLALFVGVFLGGAATVWLPAGPLALFNFFVAVMIALLVAILFRRTLRRRMEEAARRRGRRRRAG